MRVTAGDEIGDTHHTSQTFHRTKHLAKTPNRNGYSEPASTRLAHAFGAPHDRHARKGFPWLDWETYCDSAQPRGRRRAPLIWLKAPGVIRRREPANCSTSSAAVCSRSFNLTETSSTRFRTLS